MNKLFKIIKDSGPAMEHLSKGVAAWFDPKGVNEWFPTTPRNPEELKEHIAAGYNYELGNFKGVCMIEQISKNIITSSEWVFYKEITNDLEDYEDLLLHLAKMKTGDDMTLHLCCPGGSCDVGFKIITAIKSSKGAVHIVVENTCYSMGALIAISGKSLEMSKHSSLMFHTFSYGTYGKSDEVKQQTINSDKIYKEHIDEICSPFLTKPELRSMHDCKDIYISWDDPTLQKRIDRHFK